MFDETRSLFRNHGGLMAVCFLLMMFSIFGQSMIFGLYLPQIQSDLDMTRTMIGLVYAIATILSSILVVFSGKVLDYMPLRYFVMITLAGMALGCFIMAGSYTVITLFLAFLLLRHFGQGLMVISASASINRYLDKNRGKAVALTHFGGAPVHMLVFPFLILAINAVMPWRGAWIAYGFFILVVLMPAFWLFLKNHQEKTHKKWAQSLEEKQNTDAGFYTHHWTPGQVLKDWRVYALVAISTLSPFVGTVIFFYQSELAAAHGLSLTQFVTAFPVFTVAMIAASLVAGHIIDTRGEKPALIIYPILYALGLFMMTMQAGIIILYAGMALIGAATGVMSTTGGPLLANMYGTKYLSGVKSLLFSAAIIASALSPFIFGYLLDRGYDILDIFRAVVYYAAVVWILAFPVCKKAN